VKLASFEAIAKALDKANVRYIIAGGLAVNAHGYLRFTSDIDLVIAFDTNNIKQAFDALENVGYKPSVPITAEQFSNAQQRQEWLEQKGMQVLNFWSDNHRETKIDIFVREPFDFDAEYEICLQGELLPGLITRFTSIPTLIKMKEIANRPKDLDDIQHLRWILEEYNND